MSATLERRIENLEAATNAEQPAGVWLFWSRGIANGNFGFPQIELTEETRDLLLAEWIARTDDFHDGDGYSCWFEYGLDEQSVWRLRVSTPFVPQWTTGNDVEFLPMTTIESVKAFLEVEKNVQNENE